MYFSSQSACFSLATGSTLKSATCLQLQEWHRLLWSAFLHADESHLYYNMSSFLWKVGELPLAACVEPMPMPGLGRNGVHPAQQLPADPGASPHICTRCAMATG